MTTSTAQNRQLFKAMQTAIDAVGTSTHPINKIAATLALADGTFITSPNIWLPQLAPHGSTEKIGDCSPTIHAEVAAIMDAIKQGKPTDNADLYLTDPPCPNCVKMLIEAGIKNIYIDIKGFRKDWYTRRKEDFKTYSLLVAAKAGVAMHIIERFKNKQTARARSINKNALSSTPKPEILHTCTATDLTAASTEIQEQWGNEKPFIVVATSAAILAFQESTITEDSAPHAPNSKYNLITRPINHMIANCAKYGLKPIPPVIAARTPTARELINFFGLTRHVWDSAQIDIQIVDKTIDPNSPKQTKGHEALLLFNQYGLIKKR